MTTETDPKPEVLVAPYEPAEPLPGVAPELRHDAGGYWRAEAGRGGEPDWRAEVRAIDAVLGNRSAFDDCHTRAEKVAKAIREAIVSGELRVDVRTLTAERDALRKEAIDASDAICAALDEIPDRPKGEPLVDGVRRVVEEGDELRLCLRMARESHAGTLALLDTATSERDALRAEVERLKGDVAAIQSRCPEAVEAMSDRGLLAAGSPYSPEVKAKVKARALDVLVSMTTDDLSEEALGTALRAPPARNDAPDVAGEGPAPVEAQGGGQEGEGPVQMLDCDICLKVPMVMNECARCGKGVCVRCSIAIPGEDAVDAVCLRCAPGGERETAEGDGHGPAEFIDALQESDLPAWATERAIQMQAEAIAFTDAILPVIGEYGLHEDFVEAVKRVVSERDRFLAELNQRRADAAKANADYLELRKAGQRMLDEKNKTAENLRGTIRMLAGALVQLAPYPPEVSEFVVAAVEAARETVGDTVEEWRKMFGGAGEKGGGR